MNRNTLYLLAGFAVIYYFITGKKSGTASTTPAAGAGGLAGAAGGAVKAVGGTSAQGDTVSGGITAGTGLFGALAGLFAPAKPATAAKPPSTPGGVSAPTPGESPYDTAETSPYYSDWGSNFDAYGPSDSSLGIDLPIDDTGYDPMNDMSWAV